MKFADPAANALQAELNATLEPAKVTAARRLIAQAQPGAQRRQVADKLFAELADSGATEAEYLAVWQEARTAELDEPEETGPRPPDRFEQQMLDRQAEREAIVAAGGSPVWHVADGRWRDSYGDYMVDVDVTGGADG